MADLNLIWSGDLVFSPTGDIALVDGPPLGTQRVLRRLMTNPGDYIWNPTYGAGLGQYVGYPVDPTAIRSLVLSQMRLETAVAQTPEPVILVNSDVAGQLSLQVQYADADTAASQTAIVTVGGSN